MNSFNTYCHSCGVKLPPSSSFCPKCGTSQASLSEKPPTAEQVKKQSEGFTPTWANGEDDDMEIDKIQHLKTSLSSLDVDYGRPNVKGESLKDLVTQGANTPPETINRPRPNVETDPRKIAVEFQKESAFKKIEID